MKLNRIISLGLERKIKSIRSFNDLKTYSKRLIYTILSRNRPFYTHYKAPPVLHLEPTNYCNLNCICCPSHRSSREKGYMDFYLFQKIIDDASQIGVRRIHLWLDGEPLLHPQIVEMVSYIKSKNLAVELTTNGMLFNKEKIEAILQSGLNSEDNIIFSVLGYSKEIHEMIMNGVNHDTVIKNIFDFLKTREKYKMNGPVVKTDFYIMPENEHEEKQFVKYWSRIVDHARIKGRISEGFRNYKKKQNNILPRKHTCWSLWNRMTIFWNGDVTICCQDVDGDYVLGSLKEQSIREIWNSKQLLAVKKLHQEKQFQKFPLCSNCDFP